MHKQKTCDVNAKSALVGCSGFVGSNLHQKLDFTFKINSKNSNFCRDKNVDFAVCAGAPGSMYQANAYPEMDLENIKKLTRTLKSLSPKTIVLISTIAVFDSFDGGYDERSLRFRNTPGYGSNRRYLEEFCQDNFPNCLIVRLPSLFGVGLKKNFLFDLINPIPSFFDPSRMSQLRNCIDEKWLSYLNKHFHYDEKTRLFVLDRHSLHKDKSFNDIQRAIIQSGCSTKSFYHQKSEYQFYDLSRLHADISIALTENLKVVHLVTEPITTSDIHEALTGIKMNNTNAPLHRENLSTIHGGLFDSDNKFIETRDIVIKKLKMFYDTELSKIEVFDL